MSDDTLLSPQLVTLSRPSGKPWSFAVCDFDMEFMFQAKHQQWTRNQIETMRPGVSPQAYADDAARFVQMLAENRFAFGGTLSFNFITSDQGAVLYLAMLAQKAGCQGATEKTLAQMRRAERPVWDRLLEDVLRRDFPNYFPPAPSPAPATPSISTTDFTSCSAENPGDSPATPSADSPAATSST